MDTSMSRTPCCQFIRSIISSRLQLRISTNFFSKKSGQSQAYLNYPFGSAHGQTTVLFSLLIHPIPNTSLLLMMSILSSLSHYFFWNLHYCVAVYIHICTREATKQENGVETVSQGESVWLLAIYQNSDRLEDLIVGWSGCFLSQIYSCSTFSLGCP